MEGFLYSFRRQETSAVQLESLVHLPRKFLQFKERSQETMWIPHWMRLAKGKAATILQLPLEDARYGMGTEEVELP